MYKNFWILSIIILLAAILRFWSLGGNPPGLTWDEVSHGYNAYSILQTGRDEYGNLLPLNLKSFGDYKPALYTYFTIPFVAVLGLTEAAVRFPSALAGVGIVILIYLLLIELTKNVKLGLLGSLMAAVSPLAVQFSRPAFETNVALFFNLLGTFLFLKGLKKNIFLPLSAVSFGLSLFVYQASRLFVPLLVLGLIVLYFKDLSLNRRTVVSAGILAVFAAIMVFVTVGMGQSNRLAVMNYFAYRRSESQIQEIVKEDRMTESGFAFQLMHGEWFAYARGLLERYLIYFSPKMLFLEGDYGPRHRVPDLGVLSYASVLFIPLGIVLLWRRFPGAKLIFLWWVLAPLPGALSRDLITMMRSFNLLFPLAVLEGAGLYLLGNIFWKLGRRWFAIFAAVAVVFLIGNLLIFLDRYFIHAPKEYSAGWLYGYKEAVTKMAQLQQGDSADRIVMTDSYGQPYIYYLFYTKYPPQRFQRQAVLDQPTVDVGTVRKIDNIEFRHVYWPQDRFIKNGLFIGSPEELPDRDILPFADFRVLDEVKFLDGLGAFKIVESKP